MPEHVLTFPPPADPISMNQGDTWTVRNAAADWRDRSYFAWCEQFPGQGPAGRAIDPAEVHVTIPFPTNRRRDPINFAKTVKHIVDGICMAGAWPDDTPDWVTQHIPTLHPRSPGGLVIVRVTPRAPHHPLRCDLPHEPPQHVHEAPDAHKHAMRTMSRTRPTRPSG